ncbi:hypothetical protein C446_02015 [Halobiforma nitratireducens JCM 10879]|uniref:Uncharacterized protein n=1 Tax=Halobiforma nitratireducens JCM 10879 TaxID=1227454 RepID=M0MK27_9EURY|nr:hypothetical protein C446_02015 [Halobiforma nitratireducens JCM 10879]
MLALTGGCTAFGTESESSDSLEPELPTTDEIQSVLDGEWERDEESITAPLADDATVLTAFSHAPEDDEMATHADQYPRLDVAGLAQLLVRTHDDTDGAREWYDDHPDGQRGLEAAGVATESIVGGVSPSGEPSQARVLFRDATAVGWVSYWTFRSRSAEEYETTALELAETVHESWRSE